METRKLLNFVNNYLFGNRELKEIDIEFQIALEEKILSLKIQSMEKQIYLFRQ